MSISKTETTEEFLARGGVIEKIKEGMSNKRKSPPKEKKQTINAQALLDAAVGTEREEEVVNFLKSQGIEVE